MTKIILGDSAKVESNLFFIIERWISIAVKWIQLQFIFTFSYSILKRRDSNFREFSILTFIFCRHSYIAARQSATAMATGRLVRNFPWCHNKRPDEHTNYPPYYSRPLVYTRRGDACAMVCGALRSVWNSIETSRILMAVVALKRSLYYRPRMTIGLIMNYDDSFFCECGSLSEWFMPRWVSLGGKR